MKTITHDVTLVIETCCVCGTPFGIESVLHEHFKDAGDYFYCPNGHAQHYTESTMDQVVKLKRQLKNAQESADWWKEQAETKAMELRTTRATLTKIKKRLAGGACPCCHRQFVQLARHMKTKHPDYAGDGNETGGAEAPPTGAKERSTPL